MTWAMEGLARIPRVISKDMQYKVRDAIEQKYMGAGPVFDKFCEAAHKANQGGME